MKSSLLAAVPDDRTVCSNYRRKLFLKVISMKQGGIPIGDVSRRTGCKVETIRYYERIGLLPPPDRHGRYRRYDPGDVRRLMFVRRARELGFRLDEVRALLKLSATGGTSACLEVREISMAHLVGVRARITDLRAMELALSGSIRQCDAGQQPGCPLIDALSR
jgi:MerR family mercuric resistance operon transcriptional regulator